MRNKLTLIAQKSSRNQLRKWFFLNHHRSLRAHEIISRPSIDSVRRALTFLARFSSTESIFIIDVVGQREILILKVLDNLIIFRERSLEKCNRTQAAHNMKRNVKGSKRASSDKLPMLTDSPRSDQKESEFCWLEKKTLCHYTHIKIHVESQ